MNKIQRKVNMRLYDVFQFVADETIRSSLIKDRLDRIAGCISSERKTKEVLGAYEMAYDAYGALRYESSTGVGSLPDTIKVEFGLQLAQYFLVIGQAFEDQHPNDFNRQLNCYKRCTELSPNHTPTALAAIERLDSLRTERTNNPAHSLYSCNR